ncbi:FecR family protein [uncultured Muribaculum sp.]|uniref:FecR family protein n=1 Tax=uncultured Muribaculum sp. TaxID=1918613 RepID=UPI0026326C91|nr:FecR domain-containing protein [uncultured Muribaculum sp.]
MDEKIQSIITRFINNESSEEETVMLNRWLHESPDNARTFFEMERAMLLARDTTPLMRGKAVSQWLQLEGRIDRSLAADAPRQDADTGIPKPTGSKKHIWAYVAAACVAAVVVAGSYRYFAANPVIETVTVAAVDTPREVMLPDSTTVWLNSNSRLTYPREFLADASTRSVSLDGEGYFEVTSNPHQPFIVSSPLMDVEVLGTKFNMQAGHSHVNYVSLIEGSVQVKRPDSHEAIVLVPGQKAVLDTRDGRFDITEVNTRLDAVWRNRVIPFNDADIFEIKKSLEYLYGVHIIVSDKIDTERRYSGGTCRFSRIDSALNYISLTVPITYRVEGDTVYLNPRP